MKGGRPEFFPPLPEGLPERMFSYFRFYLAKDWHPRKVDALRLDEEYWLPVMEEAFSAASSAWAETQSGK